MTPSDALLGLDSDGERKELHGLLTMVILPLPMGTTSLSGLAVDARIWPRNEDGETTVVAREEAAVRVAAISAAVGVLNCVSASGGERWMERNGCRGSPSTDASSRVSAGSFSFQLWFLSGDMIRSALRSLSLRSALTVSSPAPWRPR
ncbi:hypothetical protein B296_00020853 [Ensete ventricosum]|uniref:Uncharacterized protein n=1 Tax=Ensete ventricosum TaxID=4639 RepID=A0A426ZH27_ENSVE|nr:hypothetical protein B296_00020853 [Ensete ventricosum]